MSSFNKYWKSMESIILNRVQYQNVKQLLSSVMNNMIILNSYSVENSLRTEIDSRF